MKKWFDERHEVVGWVLLAAALAYAFGALYSVLSTGSEIAPLMGNWTALGFGVLGAYLVAGSSAFSGLNLKAGQIEFRTDIPADVEEDRDARGEE